MTMKVVSKKTPLAVAPEDARTASAPAAPGRAIMPRSNWWPRMTPITAPGSLAMANPSRPPAIFPIQAMLLLPRMPLLE